MSNRSSSMDQPLQISVDQRPEASIVRLAGSCTMELSDGLRDRLAAVATSGPALLLLDLADLEFIDSAGLGGLVAAHVHLRRRNGAIRLINPRPNIRDVLEVTQLVRLFPIDGSVNDALQAGQA